MGSKDLLLSKTIWGAILNLVAMLSLQLGWDIGDKDVWVEGIVSAIGLILIVWGRIDAKRQITSIAGVSVRDAPERRTDRRRKMRGSEHPRPADEPPRDYSGDH